MRVRLLVKQDFSANSEVVAGAKFTTDSIAAAALAEGTVLMIVSNNLTSAPSAGMANQMC